MSRPATKKPGKKPDSWSFEVKLEQALGFRRLVPSVGVTIEGALLGALNEIDAKRDEVLVVTVARKGVG